MYLMYAVKGNDLYNHAKSRPVLHETIDGADVDHYFEHRMKEYKQLLKEKDAAWYQLFVLRITEEGIETVRSWGEKNPLQERIQINPQAKAKATGKSKAFTDALSAMEAMHQPVPQTLHSALNTTASPIIGWFNGHTLTEEPL